MSEMVSAEAAGILRSSIRELFLATGSGAVCVEGTDSGVSYRTCQSSLFCLCSPDVVPTLVLWFSRSGRLLYNSTSSAGAAALCGGTVGRVGSVISS